MENLPIYVSVVFGFATGLAIWLFFRATGNSRQALFITLTWLIIQAVISLTGFYTVTNSAPPRFLLSVLPPLLLIMILLFTPAGKKFIDSLNPRFLTLLHMVRILVEMVIYWLFLNKAVPQLMTFEGRNFDILSGLTAPVIFYFGFVKKRLNKAAILFWNFICLFLLINIVINAILSAPFPFQKFAFDQPNIAILYFPFVWLPSIIVPLVLFSHLAAIRQLLRGNLATTM